MSMTISWLWLMVLLAIYFAPTVVAFLRHSRVAPTFVVNLLLGWTVLGWIAALVIAVWPNEKHTEYVAVPYDGSVYEPESVSSVERRVRQNPP